MIFLWAALVMLWLAASLAAIAFITYRADWGLLATGVFVAAVFTILTGLVLTWP